MKNKDNDIYEELSQIAPKLASLQKPNLPHIPSGYFEELDQHLANLAKISQLENHEFENGLDSYFDNLEDSIIVKISQNNPKIYDLSLQKGSTSFKKLWKYAAVFVAGIMLVGIGMNMDLNPKTTENVAIQNTEYLDYILDNIEEFDLNTMIDQGLITEADLDVPTIQFDETIKDSEADELISSEINF